MQTIKQNWIYLFFAAAAILYFVTRNNGVGKAGNINLAMKTFRSEAGWGYDLYANDTVYIHQAYIPAIAGTKGFASEADARRIGELALQKFHATRFPVISLAELDSCQISR